MSIVESLKSEPCIVLDGAIGTELERLGAPMDEGVWCAAAMDTHPSLVREVHRSYLQAGAHVITTNSYASPPHLLKQLGLADRIEDWNRRAVALVREAIDCEAPKQPVYIAGSVSTFGYNFLPRPITHSQLRACFRQHCEILAEAGVDLLLLETLAATREVVEAAVEESLASGLPIWLALSCMRHRDDGRILHGIQESTEHSDHNKEYESFAPVVEDLSRHPLDALLMMHSELSVAECAVEIMSAGFDGAVGVYPNAGYWKRPQWAFVDQITPQEFVDHAHVWRDKGANIVGGCCGIGPSHINALVRSLV